MEARSIAGTEDALDPFWSPDGRWIGFFDWEGTLKRFAVSGETVQPLAGSTSHPRGASWGPDDTILFGTASGGVYRVPAAVAPPSRSPTWIPPGTRVPPLAAVPARWPALSLHRARWPCRSCGVYVGALDEEPRHEVFRLDSDARYVAPGYLLFLDGDTLLAQSFDSGRLVLSGQPTPIQAHVGRSSRGNGPVSVVEDRKFAYASATLRTGRLTWFDRTGATLSTVGPDGEHDFADFRLSGDDKRLAASLVDPKLGVPDIWLFDLARGGGSRLTFGPALNAAPVWSPHGDRIAFRTNRKGLIELYQRSAVAGGNDEPLLPEELARKAGVGQSTLLPTDWSADGQRLAFTAGGPSDIWLLTMADPTKLVSVVQSPGDQMHANFSPDGVSLPTPPTSRAGSKSTSNRFGSPLVNGPYPSTAATNRAGAPTAGNCITWRNTGRSWPYRYRLVQCHLVYPGRSSRRRCTSA